jgi:hypothetical protein
VHVLLRREGWPVNLKRVRRLYRLEGLQLRHRVRRHKHASLHRPHSSLGQLTPREYLRRSGIEDKEAATF